MLLKKATLGPVTKCIQRMQLLYSHSKWSLHAALDNALTFVKFNNLEFYTFNTPMIFEISSIYIYQNQKSLTIPAIVSR